MRRGRAIAGALALGALGLGAAAPARANPADMYGFGARGPAMGGAQVAAVDDGTANYYNPAVLARLDTIHIDLGYQVALPTLRTNDQDNHVDSSRGTAIDLAVPGHLGGLRLAFGTGIFLPDEALTRLRNQSAQQPRWAIYDNLAQRIVFGANGAVMLGDRLAIGGGMFYMAATKGTVQLRGLVGFPRPELSQLDTSLDVDLDTIRYPAAGVWYRALPWLDLGFSYRGGFKLIVDLRFRIQGDVGLPGQPPVVQNGHIELHTVSQDLFQPAQWTAGLVARLTPRFTLAYDLSLHRWSAFTNPSAHIDPPDIDVGQFQNMVHIPPFSALPDPRFHDIVVPRLGLEWLAAVDASRRVLVRAGYSYEPSPAPEQVSESNFIDADKHTFSAGLGVQLRHGLGAIVPRPLDLDAYVGVTALAPRENRKLSAIDPIGDYRVTGHVLQLGILTRWQF